jgi:glutaredoxin
MYSQFIRNKDDGYDSDSEKISIDKVIQSIKNKKYVILYSSWCGYSRRALQHFSSKGKKPLAIEIENIQGSIQDIRKRLASEKSFNFPYGYSSRPMVFIDGKFIGGYDELSKIL